MAANAHDESAQFPFGPSPLFPDFKLDTRFANPDWFANARFDPFSGSMWGKETTRTEN
jgi:hypothetical protein